MWIEAQQQRQVKQMQSADTQLLGTALDICGKSAGLADLQADAESSQAAGLADSAAGGLLA